MALRARLPSLQSRGWRALARRVGVDRRALAALRVSLGLLLLADLLLRSRNLVAFYTDAGVLPRSLLAARYPTFADLSLHALSGDVWLQILLFGVAGVLAVALTLGYRTKTVALLSWLLLVSLHLRNPYVLNAGDSLLRRLLFWGLFLPLGSRWSLDALRRDVSSTATDSRVVSVASAAILVQVVLVYATNAVIKLQGDVWPNGTAILQVFSLDQLTILLGDVLAEYPAVLRVLGELWLVMLVASPLLLVLTGRARSVLVLAFAGMHLGMAVTMLLGIFPLVSVAALLLFLSPTVWDGVESRVVDPLRRRERVAAATDSVVGALVRVAGGVDNATSRLPWASSLPARPALRRFRARAVPAFVTVLLVLILLWNAASVGAVDTPEAVESNVDPEQFRWNMFAPAPLNVDGWYVVPGRLESGERVDAFRGGTVEWDKPAEVDRTYPSARWRKYLQDVRWSGDRRLREEFAGYFCHRWNTTHEDDLTRLTVSYVEQRTNLDGPEPTERVDLLRYRCTGPPA
ncbi:Vitamin K-dependent gamma-carboxylase [Halogranum gelatinilyticum]|uniref:Vitamin K-dependent gamma-carboxylase n=1 Tax=Halogranum gelatinilyticum TaxID=660521 RepID=A0A1G9U5I0_9EURY|nr:HTTM domain-containing protein [Halogranum gelatinilyticum]SDM55240.1 Vitamin K-dependent gamma-carboxylase [Halogranum gelatinilyticum]